MKQCPVCKNTYTDATLRYCLADGSVLTELGGEQETLVRPAVDNDETIVATERFGRQMRVDIAHSEPETGFHGARPAVANTGSSSFLKVIVICLVLGILLIAALGVAGLIYYNTSGGGTAINNKPAATPSPVPANNETDELREQIANLEKRLNEQRLTNRPANIPLTLPNQTTTTSARVSSPGDGFLALRTLPNSEAGERILKIPHGAAVSVGGCLPAVRTGTKTGRWCRASYNGYSGWVFDAYLIY